MPYAKFGPETRALAQKTNQALQLCSEDATYARNQLREFLKSNRDRFLEADIQLLLNVLDSVDLIAERVETAYEDLSDILFGSDE
jgi:hypothetical protein